MKSDSHAPLSWYQLLIVLIFYSDLTSFSFIVSATA